MGSITTDTPKTTLNLESQTTPHTYDKKEELIVAEQVGGLTVSNAYHWSEIQQNDSIIKTSKKIIWAGFIVICIGILFALFGKIDVSIITAVSGIITEAISAVVFAFVTQSNKSKLQYFKQLALSEERDKYLDFLQFLDKDAKEKLLEKMITNYCELRK